MKFAIFGNTYQAKKSSHAVTLFKLLKKQGAEIEISQSSNNRGVFPAAECISGDDEEDAPRGHPLRHTLPDGYSSTNFAWTLYCSLIVLKSSGSSAAASSAIPAALALRITAMLS